ncbi:hypothetical protein CYMTET_20602 [Cymbomonas tetramitiformis]|uniref:Uncharacterized protein n=1 Tax=Cymbomonas tetramitiformis TaxID=36881 RepID=A0AAE0G4F1_9CHLO|nr:hypothetical protein CYMTET_20602 [Cymbomonas tetramitiformis]
MQIWKCRLFVFIFLETVLGVVQVPQTAPQSVAALEANGNFENPPSEPLNTSRDIPTKHFAARNPSFPHSIFDFLVLRKSKASDYAASRHGPHPAFKPAPHTQSPFAPSALPPSIPPEHFPQSSYAAVIQAQIISRLPFSASLPLSVAVPEKSFASATVTDGDSHTAFQAQDGLPSRRRTERILKAQLPADESRDPTSPQAYPPVPQPPPPPPPSPPPDLRSLPRPPPPSSPPPSLPPVFSGPAPPRSPLKTTTPLSTSTTSTFTTAILSTPSAESA